MANETWADESAVLLEAITTTWTRPGVVVLTSSLQLSYISHEAALLSARINEARLGCRANGILPREILELCDEILLYLKTLPDEKGRTPYERCRIIGPPDHPIFLRALGLPDPHDFSSARLLILMEEIGQRREPSLIEAARRFHLTEREQRVLGELFQGLTNKEIANRLGLSDQTVKEHIRHLMRKMHVTTRTGILNRVFRSPRHDGVHHKALPSYQ